MSNNLPANIASLNTAIDTAIDRVRADGDGSQYLKLSKGGHWVYGQDDMETEPDALFAIHPGSFAIGYVAWREGAAKPSGEELRSIYDPPIQPGDLPALTDGAEWSQQVKMNMACISGEDEGMQFIYKAGSRGGRGAFADVLNAVRSQAATHPGTDRLVPIVSLLSHGLRKSFTLHGLT